MTISQEKVVVIACPLIDVEMGINSEDEVLATMRMEIKED
jgi:hypothetical protein